MGSRLPSPIAPKITRSTPATSSRPPPSSSATAAGTKSADRTPARACTSTPWVASAFMTTTAQSPPSTGQTTRCVPGPEAATVHQGWLPGRAGRLLPGTSRYSVRNGEEFTEVSSLCATEAR
ncbi:hypothetical protein [Cryobacterium breve]|uniref:hypothetical protein n=1 Tax=Cryobacterium breve TaxID=1259258 RepID=UPI00248CDEE0|nr:hypothetical protein [Cryobacterium breve]